MRTTLAITAAITACAATAAVAFVPPAGDSRSDRAEVSRGSSARSAAWKCDRTATSEESLAGKFRSAKAGQTVCLASGSYGTFRGGAKSGTVTVRPQPGASASLAIEFDGANNVRVQGVTIREGYLTGGTRNVTIAHSRFTGIVVVDQRAPSRPHIVLNHNTHINIPGATDDYTSRVHLDAPGVVVKNSLLSGGTSDGVRVGDAPHTRIIGNEFTAFDDEDPLHTDPIQFYGEGAGTIIRGNWFHDMVDVSALIMMADGGGPHLIEDNVFGPGNHTFSITWYSDNGSTIRHNTFVAGKCDFNIPCGTLNLGYKPEDDRGTGTVIKDNILSEIGADGNGEGGGRALFSSSHNLLRRQRPIGPGDVRGAPRYAGPPTAFRGFRLARGSRGRDNASDGGDRGIRRAARKAWGR